MRNFNCFNCKKSFSVSDDTWKTAVCPHCKAQCVLPDPEEISTFDSVRGGLLILKMIGGLIAVIVGLSVLF